ncbi:protein snakeskin-like [Drosophila takahashii]|uniref:protein snakeskin-like n=1 Tax=Drosophila takahashii TaxID=29030 RepID=UPI0038990488
MSIVLIESISDLTFIRQAMVVYGTLIGYLITCFILATGHVGGTGVDKRLEILFSIGGFVLFVATGVIILDQWLGYCKSQEDREVLLVSGILSLATGAIFVGDIFVILGS